MTPDPIKRQPHTVPAMSDGLDPLRTYPSIPPATVTAPNPNAGCDEPRGAIVCRRIYA